MNFSICLVKNVIQMKEVGVELYQTQFTEFKIILKLFYSYMSNFGIRVDPMFGSIHTYSSVWVIGC